MFFPHLMHIKPSDLVLEIGPGAYPYWRSDCLADKFDPNDESVDLKQFGGRKMKLAGKPLFKIRDNKLPFKDKSFDYVICTHVLEHVPYEELPLLISEINRVSNKKYIEFPIVPYDYFYNFNVHNNFLDIIGNEIICLPKEYSGIEKVKVYTDFMFNMRIVQRLGIERGKYWLFGTGREYEEDIEFKIVRSAEEFFDSINEKYNEKLPICKSSFLFLVVNKMNKILRKFKKERGEKSFQYLLL